MTEIRDFHAHIYFDPDQIDEARALGRALAERFGVSLGHFHERPVGPHPSSLPVKSISTVRDVATWLSVHRAGLTVSRNLDGDDRADHAQCRLVRASSRSTSRSSVTQRKGPSFTQSGPSTNAAGCTQRGI